VNPEGLTVTVSRILCVGQWCLDDLVPAGSIDEERLGKKTPQLSQLLDPTAAIEEDYCRADGSQVIRQTVLSIWETLKHIRAIAVLGDDTYKREFRVLLVVLDEVACMHLHPAGLRGKAIRKEDDWLHHWSS